MSNEKDFPVNLPPGKPVSKWRNGEPVRKSNQVVTEPLALNIEDSADKLEKHWQECRPARKDRVKNTAVKAEIGEIVDCEVSNWHSIGLGPGTGFAWILPRHDQRGSLYIREADVMTTGTIQVGMLIRCVVSPPPEFNKSFEGAQIEKYQDEFQPKKEK